MLLRKTPGYLRFIEVYSCSQHDLTLVSKYTTDPYHSVALSLDVGVVLDDHRTGQETSEKNTNFLVSLASNICYYP